MVTPTSTPSFWEVPSATIIKWTNASTTWPAATVASSTLTLPTRTVLPYPPSTKSTTCYLERVSPSHQLGRSGTEDTQCTGRPFEGHSPCSRPPAGPEITETTVPHRHIYELHPRYQIQVSRQCIFQYFGRAHYADL